PQEDRPLHGRRARLPGVLLEERDRDVEVPAATGGPGQGAEDREGPPHPLAVRLSRQEGERHPQPAPGHAELVDLLLVAGQRLGQAAEDPADALLELGGRTVESARGCHTNASERAQRLAQSYLGAPDPWKGLAACRLQ